MTGLSATRTTRRRALAYAILVSVTLGLMAASSTAPVLELQKGLGFAFRPFESALTTAVRSVGSVVGAVSEIDRLRQANEALALENQRLQNENARAPELQREVESLTGLLQLRSGFKYKTVAASVVAREVSDLSRVVTLDVGTDQGVAEGDVVVAAGGALAGRVKDVGPNFAHMVLINDSTSAVVGQLQSSAATGVVDGQLGGVLIMQNIDSTERIQLGESIVTAGLQLPGGVRSSYPKGLLIGSVVDVARDANDVVQTAFLQPAVDLDQLEYVLVITDYEGGLPDAAHEPTRVTNPDGTLPEGEQPFLGPTASPKPAPSPSKKP